MQKVLFGNTIKKIETLQPKCLNIPIAEFNKKVRLQTIENIIYRGKWILVQLQRGWICINMGMGGELLLVTPETLPKKHRIILSFMDGKFLSINFWWFGYVHYSKEDPTLSHPMISKLGPNVLDLTEKEFFQRISGQRKKLKAFLLDQTQVAGIGNAYIHDILFLAKLHPLRQIPTLTETEIKDLYHAIRAGLLPSLKKHGAFYELDLFGRKGRFQARDILIGYRENTPCPECGTKIVKIKTGGTSSFICPSCQTLA
jgi:formamidopyrimidine-DNA glycosylase